VYSWLKSTDFRVFGRFCVQPDVSNAVSSVEWLLTNAMVFNTLSVGDFSNPIAGGGEMLFVGAIFIFGWAGRLVWVEVDVKEGDGATRAFVWVEFEMWYMPLVFLPVSPPFWIPSSNARFHNFPRGEFGADIARWYNFSVAALSDGVAGAGGVDNSKARSRFWACSNG